MSDATSCALVAADNLFASSSFVAFTNCARRVSSGSYTTILSLLALYG